MPRWAWNRAPARTKREFFELIRHGVSGQAASLAVGVSPSCGSLWFIDAGRVNFIDRPISSRYLSQDDRIEIADGLAAGEPVKAIAARIGKCYQTVYREIARNRKPDGRYQPWFAHGQAYERRRRPRPSTARRGRSATRRYCGKARTTLVATADQPLATTPLATPAVMASERRDDLRSGLPRHRHHDRSTDAADRSHLPAQARPRPLTRWSAEAVDGYEVDPRPTDNCRVAHPDRALRREI
jgi:hypothetical protein